MFIPLANAARGGSNADDGMERPAADDTDGPCLGKNKNDRRDDSSERQRNNGAAQDEVIARMPVESVSECYNMNHAKRGLLYVFVHQFFDKYPERKGSDKDLEDIKRAFENLHFEIHAFRDLKLKDVRDHAKKVADMDHTNYDCFAMIILSHGEHDIIYAKDEGYNPETEIYNKFSADKCPTLAGKPKLFFIQACQGTNLDPGVKLVAPPVVLRMTRTEFDGDGRYTLPVQADFLIAYATYRNYKALRNPVDGSYFINKLCQELDKHAYQGRDILYILTAVNRRVAIEVKSKAKEEKDSNKKQAPYFRSSLTRFLIFTRKKEY